MKLFIILGAIHAFLAVALGAFGSHGLEGKVDAKYLDIWKTAVQYQMFHALGLIIVGFLIGQFAGSSALNWSGWLMFAGIMLFSGSLFALVLTGISKLGAITPIGGVAFLAAWVLLIVAAVKNM
ncbi:DUF423 domain-containing protein [Domibacillus sp. DTU_2020_1001157_1_SI_ALB_TIR_016]|uniref:DUF423 domain-containing protein n=1 Tax=Domibacillus sp. DTU_2020_1001157_1_SI_ALB_TIR_016 TaxID=3077789 RepID=UPI0028E70ADB|nr:DUF423 domain-containing protein [Domibacillus sp. DTU_2020_1001157_1_SI_ALB_TIR_016]WNS81076.1 DUF423 domain-containing protein [Domibacillus sp. DTU_2020_1001157_1_SI_ALB_TIR_016]